MSSSSTTPRQKAVEAKKRAKSLDEKDPEPKVKRRKRTNKEPDPIYVAPDTYSGQFRLELCPVEKIVTAAHLGYHATYELPEVYKDFPILTHIANKHPEIPDISKSARPIIQRAEQTGKCPSCAEVFPPPKGDKSASEGPGPCNPPDQKVFILSAEAHLGRYAMEAEGRVAWLGRTGRSFSIQMGGKLISERRLPVVWTPLRIPVIKGRMIPWSQYIDGSEVRHVPKKWIRDSVDEALQDVNKSPENIEKYIWAPEEDDVLIGEAVYDDIVKLKKPVFKKKWPPTMSRGMRQILDEIDDRAQKKATFEEVPVPSTLKVQEDPSSIFANQEPKVDQEPDNRVKVFNEFTGWKEDFNKMKEDLHKYKMIKVSASVLKKEFGFNMSLFDFREKTEHDPKPVGRGNSKYMTEFTKTFLECQKGDSLEQQFHDKSTCKPDCESLQSLATISHTVVNKSSLKKVLKENIKRRKNSPKNCGDTMVFHTNFHMDRAQCTKQYLEIAKLPHCLSLEDPSKDALLTLSPISGVNEAHFYVKEPGVYTATHQENSLCISVNGNVGPGSCTWTCIDEEDSEALDIALAKNGISRDKPFQLTESVIKEYALKAYTVVQEPGELIIVGVGVWHYVRSGSYTFNFAYNIAPWTVSQLNGMMRAVRLNADHCTRSVVPLTTMLIALGRHFLNNGAADVFPIFPKPLNGELFLKGNIFISQKLARKIYIFLYSESKKEKGVLKHYEGLVSSTNLELVPGKHLDTITEYCDYCRSELWNTRLYWHNEDESRPKAVYCYDCAKLKGKNLAPEENGAWLEYVYSAETMKTIMNVFYQIYVGDKWLIKVKKIAKVLVGQNEKDYVFGRTVQFVDSPIAKVSPSERGKWAQREKVPTPEQINENFFPLGEFESGKTAEGRTEEYISAFKDAQAKGRAVTGPGALDHSEMVNLALISKSLVENIKKIFIVIDKDDQEEVARSEEEFKSLVKDMKRLDKKREAEIKKGNLNIVSRQSKLGPSSQKEVILFNNVLNHEEEATTSVASNGPENTAEMSTVDLALEEADSFVSTEDRATSVDLSEPSLEDSGVSINEEAMISEEKNVTNKAQVIVSNAEGETEPEVKTPPEGENSPASFDGDDEVHFISDSKSTVTDPVDGLERQEEPQNQQSSDPGGPKANQSELSTTIEKVASTSASQKQASFNEKSAETSFNDNDIQGYRRRSDETSEVDVREIEKILAASDKTSIDEKNATQNFPSTGETLLEVKKSTSTSSDIIEVFDEGKRKFAQFVAETEKRLKELSTNFEAEKKKVDNLREDLKNKKEDADNLREELEAEKMKFSRLQKELADEQLKFTLFEAQKENELNDLQVKLESEQQKFTSFKAQKNNELKNLQSEFESFKTQKNNEMSELQIKLDTEKKSELAKLSAKLETEHAIKLAKAENIFGVALEAVRELSKKENEHASISQRK